METFYIEEVDDEDDSVVFDHDDLTQNDADNHKYSSRIECSGSDTGCSMKAHHTKKENAIFHVLHRQLKSHPYFSGGGSTMTRVDNKLYFYGGCRMTGIASDGLFCYDYDDDEWIEIPEENSEASNNKPSPRYGHSAISYQEQVFIFGGQGESHNPTRYDDPSIPALSCWNDMYIYNSKLQSWSEIVVSNNTENIPSPRNSHSAVILDNPSLSEPNAKMIIFGGANELIGPNNECWQFDLTAKTWERLHCIGDENFGFPDAREMHTACIVNYCQTVIPDGDIEPNKTGFENIHKIEMIIMGGRKESGEICKDCWSLNLVTLRWRRLPDPPTPRCSHTAQFVPRTEGCKMYPIIYFFGGWDGSSTIFDSFLQYDIFEQSWSCSAYVNMAKRFAHVSCMNESCDKMYIFGGINREKELSSLLEVTFPHVTLDERES